MRFSRFRATALGGVAVATCTVMVAPSVAAATQDESCPPGSTRGIFKSMLGSMPPVVKDAPAPDAVAGNGVVYLSWPAHEGATKYTIAAFETETQAALPVKSSTTNSLTFTGLTNGKTYEFYVQADNDYPYTFAAATPLPVAPKPTKAPTLAATTYDTMTVNVTALTMPAGTEALEYYQAKATSRETGNTYEGASDSASDRSIKIEGLAPGETYDVVYAGVNTVDGKTTVGPYGSLSLAVTPTGAPVPADVQVLQSGNRTVWLDWMDVPDADRYVVRYYPVDDESVAKKSATILLENDAPSEKKIAGLDNGREYAFEVAAQVLVSGKLKTGDYSEPVIGVAVSSPIPSDFIVEAPANKSAYFEWTSVSDVQGYYIKTEVYNDNGIASPAVPAAKFIAPGANEMREVVTGLTNNVTYAFRIATKKDNQVGDYSDEVALGTPIAVPGIATPTKKAVSSEEITVVWNAPGAITGVPAADRYKTYFKPTVGDTIVVDSTDRSATASGLVEGMTYAISVQAGNANGYGYINPKPLMLVATDRPGAVVGLKADRVADNSVVVLDWSAPTYSGGAERPNSYRVDAIPAVKGDFDPPAQIIPGNETEAVFGGMNPDANYEFTVYAITDGGNGPVSRIGSLGERPTAGTAGYQVSDATARFSFTASSNKYLAYEARAIQEATPSQAVLLKAAENNSVDMLAAQSTTIVYPASVKCSAGACVATFDSFADNLNGESWKFQVRATDNLYSTSNWVDAQVKPVANAQTMIQTTGETVGQCDTSQGWQDFGDNACRKYMNYTYTESCSQSCSNNCAPNGGPNGANDCWCGSMNPQGDLCCGGCYGQTCSTNCTQSKNPTPGGWMDDGTRWYQEIPKDQYTNYVLESTFPWTDAARQSNDGIYMYVNGQSVPGASANLGRCPGTVTREFVGLGGRSTFSSTLCN